LFGAAHRIRAQSKSLGKLHADQYGHSRSLLPTGYSPPSGTTARDPRTIRGM
jgi:hypothetical protein